LPDRQPEIIANEVDGSDEDADDFDQFELDLLGGDSAKPRVVVVDRSSTSPRLTQARVLKEWSKAELAERLPVPAAAVEHHRGEVTRTRARRCRRGRLADV
jgi:hypothetical protein